MNLQSIGAIFQDVFVAPLGPGQLSRLADGDESGAERAGHTTAEDESARLDRRHAGDALRAEGLRQPLDRFFERVRRAQERSDVLEYDARLGEIGDIAD